MERKRDGTPRGFLPEYGRRSCSSRRGVKDMPREHWASLLRDRPSVFLNHRPIERAVGALLRGGLAGLLLLLRVVHAMKRRRNRAPGEKTRQHERSQNRRKTTFHDGVILRPARRNVKGGPFCKSAQQCGSVDGEW